MPTGRGPARVPYLFEGRAFDELLTTLRREFECILIDGAPMEMYADSAYLAPRADGVILIVRAETTPLGAPVISMMTICESLAGVPSRASAEKWSSAAQLLGSSDPRWWFSGVTTRR